MMSSPNLDGYSVLDKIYDGSRTLVYRGIRISDHTNVVIKLLKSAYPTFSELVHFRNQYTLTQHLNDAGIVRSYSLEHCDNGYALVMEDFGGISLSDYVKTYFHGVLPLSNFLPIAQQIVQTLAVLYQQRLIHKDIKPQNILINPHTLEVKLTDFSIASALPREVQELYSPETLEGTLAYMSPEQTGRMNRGIDYRTDFYSLGVTFYELLTGQLPFQSEDPLELIHAHVSLAPIALTQRMPALPTVINQLVLKLMAKNAEDRYQSAQGLMFDLDYCGQNYRQNAEALAAFELGQQDQCDRFVISEKLYGREAELQTLLTAFDRIASPASDRLILISGASGVGKTAVIKEIHKPIAQSRGYFVQGKFDQFNRIPFSALVQAFRQLVTQLLTEDDALIATWRSQLQKALGENGRLLTNVIPELEEIIGVQPAVAELSAEAAQNRFNQLLERFIYGFTRVDRPLVIFLDDLQWADLASLKLLKQLACEPLTGEQVPQILFIGAYRDHEFMPLMDDLQQAAQRIYLQPLTADHLTQWIADTLNCDVERSRPLAQLVHQKRAVIHFLARNCSSLFTKRD
jgi:serine/threonine protein kinase